MLVYKEFAKITFFWYSYRIFSRNLNGYLLISVQYIHPSDSHKLGQAELVCIDEAAAIPLPLVKNLLGPYLVFMSSTINGYLWLVLSFAN